MSEFEESSQDTPPPVDETTPLTEQELEETPAGKAGGKGG